MGKCFKTLENGEEQKCDKHSFRIKFPILWERNLAQIPQYGEEPAEALIHNFLHMSFLYLDCSNSVFAAFFEMKKNPHILVSKDKIYPTKWGIVF